MTRIPFAVTALLLLVAGTGASSPAPEAPPPCDSPPARAFDFWLGKWTIRERILAADGSWLTFPAATEVSRALDGCALIEHWRGRVQFFWEGMQKPQEITGLSVRTYDPESGTWTIWWMDSRRPRFTAFRGAFDGGTGTFFRADTTRDGRPMRVRITFAEAAPDSVHWDLAVSTDTQATWTTLWVMEMGRSGN